MIATVGTKSNTSAPMGTAQSCFVHAQGRVGKSVACEREIESELNATALVVIHEEGPLLRDAQRLVRIEAGRIMYDGPMSEARTNAVAAGA